MKIIYILFITGLFQSCDIPKQKTILILHDRTAERPYVIDSTGMTALLNLEDNMWQGLVLIYKPIINVDYGPEKKLKLESEHPLFGNEGMRKQKVGMFKNKVHAIITQDTATYSSSSIWIPLWEKIKNLSLDTNGQTTIYLISDLMEHTNWVSFYDPKTQIELEKQPVIIQTLFRSYMPELSPCSNLKLIIIHQPKSKEENTLFRNIIKNLYRPICEELNIPLSIQAKL